MITYLAQATSVSIGTEATLIVTANKDRSHLEILCNSGDSGAVLLVGGSGVDGISGYPLKVFQRLVLDGVSATAAVYGLGSANAAVLEVFA